LDTIATMTDDSLDERLARIEASLGAIQAAMATKADLAGMAKNVDVEALGRLVRQSVTETGALRDELRVVSALTQQLVGAVSGFTTLLRSLVDQQARTAILVNEK
jgi:hypothetical protein